MNLALIVPIVITAIIVILILISMKSNDIDMSVKSGGEFFGCLFGGFILVGLLFGVVQSITGCFLDEPIPDYTKVVLVSSGKTIKVPNKDFKDRDTIHIGSSHTYKNDTGRDLVEYAVKYTKDGYGDNKKPIGFVIKPNEYFYWVDDNDDYRMFCSPPTSTTVVYRGYGKYHKTDYHYLHFLDYVDNVKESVELVIR